MLPLKLKRLNLAIARRCFVACKGCYTYFGKHEPDMTALTRTIDSFVQLGIDEVTISGGDPLTITNIYEFLISLRSIGVRKIKLDTVGTNLLTANPINNLSGASNQSRLLDLLIQAVDHIGIPLDSWSNASAELFRTGRPSLHDEIVLLLNAIDSLRVAPNIIINTVAHRQNLNDLGLILDEVVKHRSVCQWNIFQYTPTDQVPQHVNNSFVINKEEFSKARNTLLPLIRRTSRQEALLRIDFRTIESRLGEYLLINSDGDAWVPDQYGQTIHMGRVFGRERDVLHLWSELVDQLRSKIRGLTALEPWRYVIEGSGSFEGAEWSL